MKNALILYYYYKDPIEDLFNGIISNLQDELIENIENIDKIFTLLKSTIIQTVNQVDSLKPKLTKLTRSIFMPTYLAEKTSNPHPLRKDFIENINELYKEIKSSKIYEHAISMKDDLNLNFEIVSIVFFFFFFFFFKANLK